MGDDGVEGGDEGESRTSENGEEGQIERVREPKTISVLVCVCVCACVSAHEHIYVQRGRNSRHTRNSYASSVTVSCHAEIMILL